jgi:hypothetical protein
MKKRILLGVMAGLMLAGPHLCEAQDGGYWRAADSMANTITSDIAISNTKVTIDLVSFPLAQIRKLKPAEVAVIFNADINAGETGNLYRLNVPAGHRFQHHNTLCGSDDTQWMATYISGRTLEVAFFSGPDIPVFTMEAFQNPANHCGLFTYSR